MDKVGQYIQLCNAIINGSALDFHLANHRIELSLVVFAMSGNSYSAFTCHQFSP
jgi:hypothetical protein